MCGRGGGRRGEERRGERVGGREGRGGGVGEREEEGWERRNILTDRPDILSSESSRTKKGPGALSTAPEIIRVGLGLNTRHSLQSPTPGDIQGNNKHHAKGATLRSTPIPAPRLT